MVSIFRCQAFVAQMLPIEDLIEPMYFRHITSAVVLMLSVVVSNSLAAGVDSSLVTYKASSDTDLSPDPDSQFWKSVKGATANIDTNGTPVSRNTMEIRSRWTEQNLYILFVCRFDSLTLKPNPRTTAETNGLWNWDVAETFIGDDFNNINKYKEFEVSPQGEWVDLDIDRAQQEKAGGVKWSSGFSVKARIDSGKHIWYAEMKIPFSAISKKPAQPGLKLRINFYRCADKEPNRFLLTWRPTHAPSFHVPASFGTLELADNNLTP
jgi:hypothetical protein